MKSPYYNLKAEMAKRNITIQDIAVCIKKSYQTTHSKVTAKSPITIEEGTSIKRLLKTNMPLETLFAK